MNAINRSARCFRRKRAGISGRLAICGLLAAALVSPTWGQTYTFSAPVSGWSGVDLSFGPGSVGGMVTAFGTLNETLYYGSAAQTLRQVGSVSLSPSAGSFPMSWVFWSGQSSPPTGTANLTIGDGSGQLQFDTGTQNAIGGSGGGSFSWTLSLPVSGLCIVVNNGQTNTGPANYSVDLDLTTSILSASPTNLTVNEFEAIGAKPASQVATIGGTALYDGTDDGTYHYSWQLNSATATAVPEPGSPAIWGLGASALVLACLRRQWQGRAKGRCPNLKS